MEPLRGGALLEEIRHLGRALRLSSLAPLPVLALSASGDVIIGQLYTPAVIPSPSEAENKQEPFLPQIAFLSGHFISN